jgi:hypothetical protein
MDTVCLSVMVPLKVRATDVSCVEDIMVHDLDLMMYLFNRQIHYFVQLMAVKSKTK